MNPSNWLTNINDNKYFYLIKMTFRKKIQFFVNIFVRSFWHMAFGKLRMLLFISYSLQRYIMNLTHASYTHTFLHVRMSMWPVQIYFSALSWCCDPLSYPPIEFYTVGFSNARRIMLFLPSPSMRWPFIFLFSFIYLFLR